MIIQLFSVFDKALGEYNTPMAFQTRGVAIRSFLDEVKRQASDNPLSKHPEDYSLWYIGSFDSEDGLFLDQPNMECLIEAASA